MTADTAAPKDGLATLRGAQLLLSRGFKEQAQAELTDYTDHRPDDWVFINHLANATSRRVILEQPVMWLHDPFVRDYVRPLYASLTTILMDNGIPFFAEPTAPGRDDVERQVPPGCVRLSWHSFGDVANCWRIKEAYLPGYFYFDRAGYAGWAEIAGSRALFDRALEVPVDEARAWRDDLLARLRRDNVSKYRQTPNGGFQRPDRPYVFLPLQVPDDTVSRWARIGTLELAKLAADRAEALNVPLVVKHHPRDETAEGAATLASLRGRRNVVVTDASVHDLMQGAQAVLTCNSGVGFEALLQGKPVYLTGHTDYHWIAQAINSPDEIDAAFLNPAPAVDEATRDRFLTWFLRDYCIHGEDRAAITRRLCRCLIDSL